MPYRDDSVTAYTRRKPTVEPYCGTRELAGRVHDRVSDRERRDIVTALRNIAFFEDDETGEERCEINDVIDALDVHTDVDWTLNRDEVERLIDIVRVPQTGPRKYRLNAEALREWMARTHTTQKELAKMVGVTACMPSQWLHGAKEPRMSTMLNLADATGMSVYDLMEVDDA
ncbi:helix-turn-helix domain-containing protein [Collinsella bouchesdurhonensis]|uniref:helix-turn-helix domain-containing protein n=1 Tax=Collinsella bouchesdurhonensis TaxID=1907654 RepID=UPI001105C552|nr:helix-turn-helix transcriptional regulator [Collinsella bouchesdurhonensis]